MLSWFVDCGVCIYAVVSIVEFVVTVVICSVVVVVTVVVVFLIVAAGVVVVVAVGLACYHVMTLLCMC